MRILLLITTVLCVQYVKSQDGTAKPKAKVAWSASLDNVGPGNKTTGSDLPQILPASDLSEKKNADTKGTTTISPLQKAINQLLEAAKKENLLSPKNNKKTTSSNAKDIMTNKVSTSTSTKQAESERISGVNLPGAFIPKLPEPRKQQFENLLGSRRRTISAQEASMFRNKRVRIDSPTTTRRTPIVQKSRTLPPPPPFTITNHQSASFAGARASVSQKITPTAPKIATAPPTTPKPTTTTRDLKTIPASTGDVNEINTLEEKDLQRKTVISPSENLIVPPSEKLTQPTSEKPTQTSSEKTQKLTKLPSVRSTLPPNRKTTVQSSAKPTVSTSDKPTLSPQWPPVTLQSQWPTLAPIMENPEGATMNTATDANHWLDLFQARQSQTGLVDPSPTQDSFSSLFNPSGTLPPVNSNIFSSLLPSPTRSFFDQLISVSPTNQPSFITTMVENQSTSTATRKRSEPTLPSPTNAYPPSTLGEQHKAAQEMDTSDVTKKMPGIPVTMSSMTVKTTLEPNKMYPTSVFTASPGVNTLFQAASRPEPSRRIGGNRNVPTDPAPTSTYNKEGMYMPVNASGTNTFVSMAPSFSTTVDHAQLEEQKKAMEELEKRQKQAANNLKVQQEMLKQIKEMLSALTTFFERGIVNKIMSAARTTVSSPQPTAPTRIPTFLSEEPFLNRHTRRHADVQFVTDRIEAGTKTTAVTMQPTQPTSTTTEDPTTKTTTTPTTTTRTTTTPTTTTITTTTTTPAPTTTTTTSTTMSTTPIPTTTLPSTTLPPQDFAVDAVVQGPGSIFSQIQGNADPNTPSLNELAMSAAMRQINKQVSRVEVNEGTNAQPNVPQTLSFSPLKNNVPAPQQANNGQISQGLDRAGSLSSFGNSAPALTVPPRRPTTPQPVQQDQSGGGFQSFLRGLSPLQRQQLKGLLNGGQEPVPTTTTTPAPLTEQEQFNQMMTRMLANNGQGGGNQMQAMIDSFMGGGNGGMNMGGGMGGNMRRGNMRGGPRRNGPNGGPRQGAPNGEQGGRRGPNGGRRGPGGPNRQGRRGGRRDMMMQRQMRDRMLRARGLEVPEPGERPGLGEGGLGSMMMMRNLMGGGAGGGMGDMMGALGGMGGMGGMGGLDALMGGGGGGGMANMFAQMMGGGGGGSGGAGGSTAAPPEGGAAEGGSQGGAAGGDMMSAMMGMGGAGGMGGLFDSLLGGGIGGGGGTGEAGETTSGGMGGGMGAFGGGGNPFGMLGLGLRKKRSTDSSHRRQKRMATAGSSSDMMQMLTTFMGQNNISAEVMLQLLLKVSQEPAAPVTPAPPASHQIWPAITPAPIQPAPTPAILPAPVPTMLPSAQSPMPFTHQPAPTPYAPPQLPASSFNPTPGTGLSGFGAMFALGGLGGGFGSGQLPGTTPGVDNGFGSMASALGSMGSSMGGSMGGLSGDLAALSALGLTGMGGSPSTFPSSTTNNFASLATLANAATGVATPAAKPAPAVPNPLTLSTLMGTSVNRLPSTLDSTAAMAKLTPSQMITKMAQYQQMGLTRDILADIMDVPAHMRTRTGDPIILPPKVEAKAIMLRSMGRTPDQIADVLGDMVAAATSPTAMRMKAMQSAVMLGQRG